MIGGLAAGLIGVGLLVPREALTGGSQQLWGSSAILLGAMSWALGVRYSATAPSAARSVRARGDDAPVRRGAAADGERR